MRIGFAKSKSMSQTEVMSSEKWKRNGLIALSSLCLSVGLIAILVERQAVYSEEKVKNWTQSQCEMEDLKYRDEGFSSHCVYRIEGRTYTVKRQTPAWNSYFHTVAQIKNGVEVFFINEEGNKFRFQFQKGQPAPFWYDPKNPEDSVLMPASGSLRAFLYFGIGFYLFLTAAIVGARRFAVPRKDL